MGRGIIPAGPFLGRNAGICLFIGGKAGIDDRPASLHKIFHFFLAFPGVLCYPKRVDCPYNCTLWFSTLPPVLQHRGPFFIYGMFLFFP